MRTESRAARGAVLCVAALSLGCGTNRTHPTRPAWDADAGVAPPLSCVPDLDGRIEARELMPAYGVGASFLLSPEGEAREVDIVGQVGGDGVRRWDLGTDYASDRAARFTAGHVADKWYSASFPTGQFAVADDPSGALESVYRLDDGGLYLLGFASASMDPPEGRTLWVYETPIVVFQLPLEPGRAWITTSEVRNATVRGLPYAGRDTYESAVVAAGELTLPDLTFTQAMRVTTRVTVSPSAGATLVRRQTSFLFECFGEVARVVAPDGEANDDFPIAASMRRFGL